MSRFAREPCQRCNSGKDCARFGVGDYLNLGQGEMKSGGHRRDSILADAMEAPSEQFT